MLLMFRIGACISQYKDLLRNIYIPNKYFLLGVAELIDEISFFTLQLPLSSLFSEGYIVILRYKKHKMVFNTLRY